MRSLAKVNFAGRLVLFVYGRQMKSMTDFLYSQTPVLDVELVLVRHLDAHPEFFQVLLTDVRDVVFQSDPVSDLGSGLSVSLENPTLSIATEPLNRDWIMGAYGEEMLKRIGHGQVSCAGVTLGDVASVRCYLDLLLKEALRLPFSQMRSTQYDQAFHNKLLHCGELDASLVVRCQPLQSRIATLACLDASNFRLSATGQLLNDDGNVAPIVHQYDRHPVLVQAFEKYLIA